MKDLIELDRTAKLVTDLEIGDFYANSIAITCRVELLEDDLSTPIYATRHNTGWRHRVTIRSFFIGNRAFSRADLVAMTAEGYAAQIEEVFADQLNFGEAEEAA